MAVDESIGIPIIKGLPVAIFSNQQTSALSGVSVDMRGYNAASVTVLVSGSAVRAALTFETLHESGSLETTVDELYETRHDFRNNTTFDLLIGSRYLRGRLTVFAGTFVAGQGITVIVVPHIAGGLYPRSGPTYLAQRYGITAAESGNQGSAMKVAGHSLYAEFGVQVTGSPASLDARASIEASANGEVWHEIIRFADVTATSDTTRIARLTGQAAAGEVAQSQSNLASAAATATLRDGALGFFLRVNTQLYALTGGTNPSIDLIVRAAVM